MKKKILIATATYNESLNIKKFISSIFFHYSNYDILVIDDKSPDKTYEILRILKTNFKNLKIIFRKKKEGLNTAHKLMYSFAIKHKYDYLITMDADFSHNPKEIKNILYFLKFYDFVIGSRYTKYGKCNMKFSRFLLSKYGNLLIKFFLRTGVSENTTSYRGFNLKNLIKKKIDLCKIKSSGYSFFMECVFYLKKKNCSIKEVPIIFKDRTHGSSKIPRLEIFRTLKNLFILLLSNSNKYWS